MTSNILPFRDTRKRSGNFIDEKLLEEEEKQFYEELDEITDPQDRLLHFAYACQMEPDQERTDVLLVEAASYLREHPTSSAAWFAKMTYQLLNDDPRGYASLHNVLRNTNDSMYALRCLTTIIKLDHTSPYAKKPVERMIDSILEDRVINTAVAHHFARYACKEILQLDSEETAQKIEHSIHKRRFLRQPST